MARFWPVGLAVVLFAGVGVGGLLRPAGARLADAPAVQAKLDALPLAVGAWTGRTEPYPEKTLRQAEAVAAVNRVYVRDNPPAQVGVLLLAGSPGAMGAHDPSVCFAGAGFQAVGASAKKPVGVDALWSARYDTAGDSPAPFQVCWGWSAGDKWAACDNARFEFADRGTVYKLYVTRGLPPGGGSRGQPDPTDEFLRAFLPLTQTLAGTTPAPTPE